MKLGIALLMTICLSLGAAADEKFSSLDKLKDKMSSEEAAAFLKDYKQPIFFLMENDIQDEVVRKPFALIKAKWLKIIGDLDIRKAQDKAKIEAMISVFLIVKTRGDNEVARLTAESWILRYSTKLNGEEFLKSAEFIKDRLKKLYDFLEANKKEPVTANLGALSFSGIYRALLQFELYEVDKTSKEAIFKAFAIDSSEYEKAVEAFDTQFGLKK